jgi:acid phosphatase
VGRKTTFALGQRLRTLYVDQLGFMPPLIADSDMIYLRATPIPRALESVQQAFVGFYPPSARTAAFPPPTILTRSPADETLFPNDGVCRRFAELSRAFAQRSADRWNDGEDLKYVSSKIGKWMPDGNDGRVKVDSRPRLSGVMDTINATDAHGPQTRLPKEFYDPKARAIIDRISVEEWYQGYIESKEYRALGIGGLAGDVVARMVGNAEKKDALGIGETGGEGTENIGIGRGGEREIKFGMSGCHDTTLAATLASLGCYEGEKWPPFTSHIAFELFKKTAAAAPKIEKTTQQQQTSLWSRFFGLASKPPALDGIGRTPLSELSPSQKESLDEHYVRVRFNDRVMNIPGCAVPGKHLQGDESFCTLASENYLFLQTTFCSPWKICLTNVTKCAGSI